MYFEVLKFWFWIDRFALDNGIGDCWDDKCQVTKSHTKVLISKYKFAIWANWSINLFYLMMKTEIKSN